MKWLLKGLRAPGFHFVFIGALLFAFHQLEQKYLYSNSAVDEAEIVIRKAQIAQYKKDIKAQTGLEPNHRQLQAAIEMAIDDEVLYRQALILKLDQTNSGVRHRLVQIARFVNDDPSLSEQALHRSALELGLDRSDPVVRRQLIANMKLIAAGLPTEKTPSDITPETIQTYFDKNKRQFEKPERISFSHIYLNRDRWGNKGDQEARRLLQELRSNQVQPPLQKNRGDPFLMGDRFSESTPASLQRFFGSAFSSQVFKLETGQWQGPVVSSYGWHLLWIDSIKNSQTLTLQEVENQVVGNVFQEREAIRLQDALRELRSHYKIRIESTENISAMAAAK